MSQDEATRRLIGVGAMAPPPVDPDDDRSGLAPTWYWPWGTAAWEFTEHLFGFIAADAKPEEVLVPLKSATLMEPDKSLNGARIKITLDRLYVAKYPGRGVHHVLFDFYAQNQAVSAVEHLHFNATHKATDGQHAAVLNFPIFVGLCVGAEGVAFKCYTVNVKTSGDQKLLAFLEADAFKRGLEILNTVQPALAPLSAMAYGLTRNLVSSRSTNIPVQEFHLGLDFSNSATGARLAVGSYVALQAPPERANAWKWDNWRYNRETGQIVENTAEAKVVDLNYILFSVTRLNQPPEKKS
jgi:hypothetical protein